MMPPMNPLDSLPDRWDGMNAVLAANWWALALRGAIAILFGIVAFAMPTAAMLSLVLVFAAYSLVDGIFNIVLAVRGASRHERWSLLLLNGLFGVAIGVVALLWPGITVVAFVLMVAVWALLTGGLMLAAAFRLKHSHGRWLLGLGGALSLAYGVLLVISPLMGALVLTWWLGAYAVLFGIALLALAFRLRRHRPPRPPGSARMHAG